jgi:argininosuccinate synthase
MKQTFLHDDASKYKLVKETSLGTLATDAITGKPLESQVVLSEKNFLYLISMLPKCDERTSIMNRIRHIEDKMIELKFKTTAELTTDLLLHTLNEEINQITFEADVMELVKSMPRIVGKINLEKK